MADLWRALVQTPPERVAGQAGRGVDHYRFCQLDARLCRQQICAGSDFAALTTSPNEKQAAGYPAACLYCISTLPLAEHSLSLIMPLCTWLFRAFALYVRKCNVFAINAQVA